MARQGRWNCRLIFFPPRPAARHVGAILRGRQHAFFEAHSLAMDEIPDRAIADRNAAFGEFREEPADGRPRAGRDPLMSQPPYSHESVGPMALMIHPSALARFARTRGDSALRYSARIRRAWLLPLRDSERSHGHSGILPYASWWRSSTDSRVSGGTALWRSSFLAREII